MKNETIIKIANRVDMLSILTEKKEQGVGLRIRPSIYKMLLEISDVENEKNSDTLEEAILVYYEKIVIGKCRLCLAPITEYNNDGSGVLCTGCSDL